MNMTMNTLSTPSRLAFLMDPETVRATLDRMSRLPLKGRVCRPLDRINGRASSTELAQYDAQVEDADIPEYELPVDDCVAAPAGNGDDDDDEDF